MSRRSTAFSSGRVWTATRLSYGKRRVRLAQPLGFAFSPRSRSLLEGTSLPASAWEAENPWRWTGIGTAFQHLQSFAGPLIANSSKSTTCRGQMKTCLQSGAEYPTQIIPTCFGPILTLHCSPATVLKWHGLATTLFWLRARNGLSDLDWQCRGSPCLIPTVGFRSDAPLLSCNGIEVARTGHDPFLAPGPKWAERFGLAVPRVAVFDPDGRLQIGRSIALLQRY